MTVQELDESFDCQYLKMRSLAIREAQKAMEIGVSVREMGPTDLLAQDGKRTETAAGARLKWEHDRRASEVQIGDFAHPPSHGHGTNL
jgi:hypothetical protein